jgi:hypothetical protein
MSDTKSSEDAQLTHDGAPSALGDLKSTTKQETYTGD